MRAINARIRHKQFGDHNELDNRIELDDRSNLALNDHNKDVSVERVNMRSPSNDALIVLMTTPMGCDKSIVDA